MKMPAVIDPGMLAPCGMNCMVCYKHCNHKKPCPGCLKGDAAKPEHCRKCAIKSCVGEKGLALCHHCHQYPCKLIKNLEKTYRKRYGVSLMANSAMAAELWGPQP